VLFCGSAAAAYAAFVGDGDPVDDLETIGQGNDPLTKVIGQGAQAAIELSYVCCCCLLSCHHHSFLRRIQYNR
jgi:hypothetical protein